MQTLKQITTVHKLHEYFLESISSEEENSDEDVDEGISPNVLQRKYLPQSQPSSPLIERKGRKNTVYKARDPS